MAEIVSKSCLLTGAAGIVGSAVRPLLAARYDRVLLTDLVEIADLASNETFQQGDISEAAFVNRLVGQVNGIVHLAGLVGKDYTFAEVLQPNLVGTYNVFEAARTAGVRQVVFASSHHAVGFLRRDEKIDEATAPRPDSPYGLSKAFGESTAWYFAEKYGVNVLVIRIGFVGQQVPDERRLHTWTSARDLVQLIEIGLGTPDLGCQIVYGVSDNPDPFFDNRNAVRLGYRPQDRAEDFVADQALLQARPDTSSRSGLYVGGHFVE